MKCLNPECEGNIVFVETFTLWKYAEICGIIRHPEYGNHIVVEEPSEQNEKHETRLDAYQCLYCNTAYTADQIIDGYQEP